MTRFVAFLGAILLPLTAAAQTAAAPARQATGSPATVAPPPDEDETGWHVIQMPNGYARYRDDGTDGAAPEGGVTIVSGTQEPPAPTPPVTSEEEEEQSPPPEAVAPPPESPPREIPAPPVSPPSPPGADARRCLWPQALLAQRLMELRGVELEPATALLVLSQQQTTMTCYLALSLFGRPLPLGDAFLATAISSDTVTLDLATDLADCLMP